MATLMVPEDGYATIQAAVTAASNNDAISVADGTYNETVTTSGKTGIVITSRGTDRSAVKIVSSTTTNGGVVTLTNDSSINNLPGEYTGLTTTQYAVRSVSGFLTFSVLNCKILSGVHGIHGFATTGRIDQCWVECTSKQTVFPTYGIYSTQGGAIGSTVVLDFNHTGMWVTASDIVNSLNYTNQVRLSDQYRGMYAVNIYNSIAVNKSGVVGHGAISTKGSGSTSTNCIADGTTALRDYAYEGTSNTNNLGTTDVANSGQPLFVDGPNDAFHVNKAGLSYHSGVYTYQSNNGAFLNDLDGVRFEDPPSRGPYEHVESSAATGIGPRCRLGLKLGI